MFGSIANLLDVREKMTIERELIDFVKKKKSKTSLKDRLVMPQLLECLEPDIMKVYQEKINNNLDEYDDSFAMSAPDQIFYLEFFMTTAMLKTYQVAHPSAVTSECLSELFSVETNSQTPDFRPEVTVCCDLCLLNFPTLGKEDILYLNKNVFKKQLEDNFMDPQIKMIDVFNFDNYNNSDDGDSLKSSNIGTNMINNDLNSIVSDIDSNHESDIDSNHESDIDINQESDIDINHESEIDILDSSIYNPFASMDDASDEECFIFNPFLQSSGEEGSKEEQGTSTCSICDKRFSESEFVSMHIKMFHSPDIYGNPDPRIKLNYVENGDVSINSIIFQDKKKCLVQNNSDQIFKRKKLVTTENVSKRRQTTSMEPVSKKKQTTNMEKGLKMKCTTNMKQLPKKKQTLCMEQQVNKRSLRLTELNKQTREQREIRFRAVNKKKSLFK